jgi:gamma-tubulin complex component 4
MNLGWMHSPDNCIRKDNLEIKNRKVVVSIYTRALANGINEVLSVYRSAVLKVEQDLLSDMTPVLSSVTQHLNKVT